ncbi:hypothetical protein ACVWYG_003444 [Pedobacter sp. UYEF25]
MSKWIICFTIFLWSCGIHKEKARVKTESLTALQTKEQWEWTNEWISTAYQFRDSSGLAVVFIKADAPFKWQQDSGLAASAGNYEIYMRQEGKSLSAKKQLVSQNGKAAGSETKKEIRQTVAETKTVFKTPYEWELVVFLVLLVAGGLLFIWRGFRVWAGMK